jgi:KDO2-lipid IV(A) lauroyltransferase
MHQAERLRILKGSMENLGRVFGEMSQFFKLTPADIEKLVDFAEDPNTLRIFEETRKEHRGVLVTTGHLGNWEMLVFSFAALYQPMSYLARPLDNPLLEELTVKIRTRFGNRPINKKNSAMLAIRILREGELLGILADVNTTRKEGVFVPVFGVPACTSTGAAKLAIRSNALIYPTFCLWDAERGRYKIVHAGPFEPARTGDRDKDIYETTARFTLAIEEIIRQYPEQWMWIHKRWKTRPEGEPDLYGRRR